MALLLQTTGEEGVQIFKSFDFTEDKQKTIYKNVIDKPDEYFKSLKMKQ